MVPLLVLAKPYNAVHVLMFSCSQPAAVRVIDQALGDPYAALQILHSEPTCTRVSSALEQLAQNVILPPAVEIVASDSPDRASTQELLRVHIPMKIEPDGTRL